MKKPALILAVLLVAGTASAVTNYSGPTDQPHIMGGGDGASSSTGANGSWRVDVTQTNASCLSGDENVSDVEVTETDEGYSLSFTGVLSASQPCDRVVHDVEVSDSTYRLNITSEPSNRTCVDCVGGLDYSVEAELPEKFTFQVYHDGELEKEVSRGTPEKKGLLKRFMSFLSGLF
jgi:hypothetical protein